MTRIVPEVWTRLGNEPIHGETLWARRAAPDTSIRLIAAIDVEGQRHLLVLLLDGEGELQDQQSRGISVVTRELAIPNHEPGRYLDVVCHDTAGHEVFDLIGGEIADRLAAAHAKAPESVARVLAKWRRFWSQLPRQILSRDEQLGLFAELWFLSVWLIPRLRATDAINRWHGPTGARHDFEWPGRAVEAKATTSRRGRIHHIHGLEQLVPPDKGELFIFSIVLREEGSATNSLPSVVATCRTALETDPDALDRLESLLAQGGYSPAHDDDYARLCLRIVEEGLFRVSNDFPRLTPASIPSGIPVGVERVEYEINLVGYSHLLVASSQTTLPDTWFL